MLIPLQRHLDIKTVVGYGAYPSVLEKAGIKSMDMVIAVMNSDERNMVACRMAHTLYHVEKKIARIRTTEYLLGLKFFQMTHYQLIFNYSRELNYRIYSRYCRGARSIPSV